MNDFLKVLSSSDSKWRNIATKLCGNSFVADDIVSEMYIKMSVLEYEERKTRVSYITSVMLNIYRDMIKADKKSTCICTGYDLHVGYEDKPNNNFDDYESSLLDSLNEFEENDVRLLEMSYNDSLRNVSKEADISLNILFRRLKGLRKEVLGEDYETKYNNRRLKHRR